MGKTITISLKGLEKKLGQFHLGPIDLEVQDSLVLLGPTGSGKTTLFEMIAGFIKPDNGKIFFDNEDMTGKKPEKRSIGLVYQDYQLFPHLNVKNNITFGLKLKNLSEKDVDAKVREVAERFDIKHLLNNNVRNLSGGEKQKVALARALIVEPRILLMDEPFSAVDEEGRSRLTEDFKLLRKNLNSLIILVTHNQEEAYELGEKIAIIYDGKILAYGNKLDVFSKPQKVKVARFLGFKNILSTQDLFALGVNPPTSNQFFGIPNEKIYINGKAALALKGKIEVYESLKDKVRVKINVSGIIFEKIVDKNFSFTGSEVDLAIDPKDFLPLE